MDWRSACGAALAALLVTPAAFAHGAFDTPGALWPGLLATLLLTGAWMLYGAGSLRRPPRTGHAMLFHGTALLAALTLFGPMDAWAEESLAAHMTQHMLLIVVIAPLWVLARPWPQWYASIGRRRLAGVGVLTELLRRPLLAATLHGAALWIWHAPRPYMVAVGNPWWHIAEHLCFLLSAGVFWWAVLRAAPGREPRALLALLFTLMHTGLLGALLTFAREPLYRDSYALADQQLAGLIMWVPCGLAYLLAAAWLGARWMRRLSRRTGVGTARRTLR